MPKRFCQAACRIEWTKIEKKRKAQAAGPGDAVDRKTYSMSREIEGRLAEIQKCPQLRAARERCQMWPERRISMEQRVREMQAERLRNDRRTL